MQKVYRITGETPQGEVTETEVFAANEGEAAEKADNLGVQPFEIELSWRATYEVNARGGIGLRQLGQFYETLGRRTNAGVAVDEAIRESMEFVEDAQLRISLGVLAAYVEGGMALEDAMRMAGFPEQDAALVQATRQTGEISQILRDMGASYRQQASLQAKLRGLLVEPTIFLTVAVVLVYAVMVFAIPQVKQAMEQIPAVEVPGYAQFFYGMSEWFASKPVMSGVIYFGLVATLVWGATRPTVRGLLDRIPVFRKLSQRADHAQLWNAYALMYDAAAVDRVQIANMLAETASREDNRESFRRMGEAIEAGAREAEAVQETDFPPTIAKSVANALSSPDADSVVEGLRTLAQSLQEDVDLLTDRVEAVSRNALYLVLGLFILGVIMVTIMPMFITTLSNV